MEAKLSKKFASFVCLFVFISIATAIQYPESNYTTHRFELIPRDALHPAQNLSSEALLKARLERGNLRVQALSFAHAAAAAAANTRSHSGSDSSMNTPLYPGYHWNVGEYFVHLGVGTPSKYFYMEIDTGSDIVWLQCSPCKKCFEQIGRIFDPNTSSTFARVACGSKLCSQLDEPNICDKHKKKCFYSVTYMDHSFTEGELSTDTLTFGNTKVENFPFGCGHSNKGLFHVNAGLLGLGRGSFSFPMQTLHQFGGHFSYCLADLFVYPPSKSSSLMFGPSALSKKAKFTPLVSGPSDTYYYVSLNGISVDGNRIPNITASVFKAGEGVIVDSGTPLTYLYAPAYEALRDAYRKATNWKSSTKGNPLLETCYNKKDVKGTTVTLHLEGADVDLPAVNILIQVDDAGTTCFAFKSTKVFSIIGNIQQQGFQVSFDLKGKRVGFTPHGCTRSP